MEYCIADHPTPKIDGGVAYTLESRDYKAPQCVCTTYRKKGHPQTKDQGQGWEETNVNDTLNAFDSGEMRTPTIILENHPADSRVKISKDGMVQTLSSRMGTGGGNTPIVLENHPMDSRMKIKEDGIFQTMSVRGGQEYEPHTLMVMEAEMENYIVRRLTPLECERLQGFPDGWTDIGDWTDSKGKLHKGESDSPRYKALGNSIALPFWEWMAKRMVEQLKKDGVEEPTMASLFSGIGGFELAYLRAGAIPVWNSEIESFPEAVTTFHFGDDDKGVKGDYEQYL